MEGLSQDSNRVQGYFPFWQLPNDRNDSDRKGFRRSGSVDRFRARAGKASRPGPADLEHQGQWIRFAMNLCAERLNLTLFSIFAGYCAAARDCRDLRRDVVHRNAAYSRDRHSHVDRCATTRRVQDGDRAGNDAGADWDCNRIGGSVCSDSLDGRHALQRYATDPATFAALQFC